MANIVNITTVNNSERNLVLHVYLSSDGAEGDLVDQILIDPDTLGLPVTTRFAIEDIVYNFVGFSARIEFDTGLVDDKMLWVLGINNNTANFDKIGGLFDRSGLDGTGRIQITTTGFTSSGDEGSMVICIRKGGILAT